MNQHLHNLPHIKANPNSYVNATMMANNIHPSLTHQMGSHIPGNTVSYSQTPYIQTNSFVPGQAYGAPMQGVPAEAHYQERSMGQNQVLPLPSLRETVAPITQNIEIKPQPSQNKKFESAMDFLEKVKSVFEHKPEVYTQFLEIMKEFKAQTIDTPGVIQRVKSLFQGHSDLILGFNSFLPNGHKITPQDIEEYGDVRTAETLTNITNSMPNLSLTDPAASPIRGRPELNHAKSFVKKIKLRFSNEPEIYKAFLEILHTYHRELQSIDDVYDHVSLLFQDHKDLLEEFKQFLPNNNETKPTTVEIKQEEPRKATKRSAPIRRTRSTTRKNTVSVDKDIKEKEVDKEREKEPAEPKIIALKPTISGSTSIIKYFRVFEYMIRIKLALGPKWKLFLRCLDLRNKDVISHTELLQLVQPLLVDNYTLFDWLREYVGVEKSFFPYVEDKSKHVDVEMTEVENTAQVGVVKEEVRAPSYNEPIYFELSIYYIQRTIKKLESIQELLSKANEHNQLLFDYLDKLHYYTLEQVYYYQYGNQVGRLLLEQPAEVIPVVLPRLRSKLNECLSIQERFDTTEVSKVLDWRNSSQQLKENQLSPNVLELVYILQKREDENILDHKKVLEKSHELQTKKEKSEPTYDFYYKDCDRYKQAINIISLAFSQSNHPTEEKSKCEEFIKFLDEFFRIKDISPESSNNIETQSNLYINSELFVLFRYLQVLFLDLEIAWIKLSAVPNGYHQLLEQLQQFIQKKIKADDFEQFSCKLLGVSSFSLFSIDELVSNLLIQIIKAKNDQQTSQLISTYMNNKDNNNYPHLAKQILGNTHLYIIHFSKSKSTEYIIPQEGQPQKEESLFNFSCSIAE